MLNLCKITLTGNWIKKMEIGVPQKIRTKILEDLGVRAPASLAKKAKVCERTAETGGDGRKTNLQITYKPLMFTEI